ncbi:hypothetical protein NDU88_003212 [Pleurodeles waltl]|uniref:Uncharacterized protein n=1 Tax=Pleurodeles waltl TaxID=8319 RepID=A0AAV7P8X8_PLEWA|nr:hypothetical protein NDU88_003212 [Pleurodeles waltl]
MTLTPLLEPNDSHGLHITAAAPVGWLARREGLGSSGQPVTSMKLRAQIRKQPGRREKIQQPGGRRPQRERRAGGPQAGAASSSNKEQSTAGLRTVPPAQRDQMERHRGAPMEGLRDRCCRH